MRKYVSAFFLIAVAPAMAQKFDVRIQNRQSNETDYTYLVPGYSTSSASGNVNCLSALNSTNCSGSTTAKSVGLPAQEVSYHAQRATFSLLLPDGRIAVVNCESKFAERFAGARGNHRSCRIPLIDEIQAEFSGDKARLVWPVSIDGKKLQSETYKIIGVLGRRNTG